MGLRQSFIFTGLVAPAEVPRHLAAADIVLHLSRREGLPRVLPQALAVGRPVVALDCDGAGEICLNDETGFLAPPGQWIEPLLRLAVDPALRDRLASRGRRFVIDNFSVETMVEKLYQLYQKLGQEHGISR
jgi:glycosyltransferase involved in cell wall biosynthesis